MRRAHRAALEGLRGALGAGDDEARLRRLHAAAAPVDSARSPLQLALVVDVSGSMGEQRKLARVRAALRAIVRRLAPDDVVSLAAVSDRPIVARPPASAGPDVVRDLEATIERLEPAGGTDLYAALELGASLLANEPAPGPADAADRRLVVFTDGLHRATPSSPGTLAQLRELAREAAGRGASVTVVGVGPTLDERLVAGLTARQLALPEAAVAAELLAEDLLRPSLARELRLDLRLAPGVVAEPLSGRLRERAGERGVLEADLGWLSRGDEATLAVRLTISGDAATGGRDLAEVVLRYVDAEGGAVERRQVLVGGWPTSDAPRGAASLVALEEWIGQDTRDAARRAYELLAAGRPVDAERALDAALARLADPDAYR